MYGLAAKLGRANVDQLAREITWQQFLEWQTYQQLEPWGEERADIRAAQITAALYNVNRTKKSKPVKIKDVLLRFGDEAARPQQDWRSMQAMAKFISSAWGDGGRKK